MQGDRFRDELKTRKIASAERAAISRKRSGKSPNRALRFGDLDREQVRQVRELAAPRESWLGMNPEY